MTFAHREIWLEAFLLALPGAGLLASWIWPWTAPFLGIASLAAALPFVIATIRGFLDRRLAAEAFPTVALGILLWSREWTSAAAIALLLGTLRLIEQRLEARALAAVDAPLRDIPIMPETDQTVEVRTGERIPADGIVVHGAAFVDEALIRGDDRPVERLAGDPVFAGTLVQAGTFRLRAVREPSETLIMRLRRLIHGASAMPSPTERVAGHASAFSYWLLGVVSIAVWFFFHDFDRLAAVLLILRPDALAAAVSLAASMGVAAAGRRGALAQGGAALDRLAECGIAVFDKTGPLAFADVRIGELEHDPGFSDAYIWECIAVAEAASDHPVGRALYREAVRHIGRVVAPDAFQALPGRGVVASLAGHEIVVGTAELHRAYQVSFDSAWLVGSTTPVRGGISDTFLALDGVCVARVRIEEHARPDVRVALEGLRTLGFSRTVLFTPDTVRLAAKQAATIGLDDYRPSITPEERWKELGRLSRDGNVLLVGDGVHDAEAMCRAHASVAISTDGSPSKEASLLLHADALVALPKLVELGRTFRRIVRAQCVTWVVTGSAGLILSSLGWLAPVAAAGYALTTSLALHVFIRRIFPTKAVHGQDAQNRGK